MYDWSLSSSLRRSSLSVKFQLLLKGCTIEAWACLLTVNPFAVSVVVERMYDWSGISRRWRTHNLSFSCCWKDVRLKLHWVSQTIGCAIRFSCCWKDVRLKQFLGITPANVYDVSVVVERMYDWSSETNWLKTNDFWQLVSDLFFENGRSAQKVPLFSKIWGDLGDCLTVFDSCSNI